ncbi:Rapamycin-insensitive companion of mTOR, N-term-domain-containing protein [Obelidium mucronatum]|nr:Rapamycin-insensitive companion of mTOR, N-term-domain-containing protein [Obelidium mucronatum]
MAIDAILVSLRSNPAPQVRLAAMNNLLRELRAAVPSAAAPASLEVIRSLRCCLTDSGKEIRANAFRILRHIVTSDGLSPVRDCMEVGIDLFIVRALTRDQRFDLEREQAIKLVRAFLDVDNALSFIDPSIVRMLVSLAENPEDKLRVVSLESICEVAILNTELLAKCGGIRVIFGALGEVFPRPGINNMIVSTVVFLLDSEATRQFLRPEVELEAIISCLTDPLAAPDRIKACTQILSLFLKSWTGIIYLSMNGKRSVRAMVDCLRLPNDVCRSSILEMIFGVLGVKIGGDQYVYNNVTVEHELPIDSDGNSLYHFQCVLLIVFMDVGLLETLSHIVQTENKEIATLATILASEIQKLSLNLPPAYATHIQSMSSLFEMASDFSNEFDRHYVKEVVGGQIDDLQFKNIVSDAEKMFIRDSSKWSWDFILEFLLVLLNNSRRADEVLKSTKVLRRLLSFFKPVGSGFRFDMNEKDIEIVKSVGCNLMRVLLSCSEGVNLLTESRFMIEISEEFNKLDPVSGPLPANALFGRQRMERNASGIYFNFLSELANTPSGQSTINRFKIYNMYFLITELPARDDLIKALVHSFDFSKDGHERVILAKLMTSSEKDARLFATEFAGKLLSTNRDEDTRVWCVQILVTQMYDQVKEIRDKAKNSLEGAAELPGVIEAILGENPAYYRDVLTNALYMRFLRLPEGFEYLRGYDYISGEMAFWIQFGIFNYVTRAELLLEETYGKPKGIGTPLQKPLKVELLEESGHFNLFLRIIRENKQDDAKNVACLKACLWSVGHIGSSMTGMQFLLDSKVLADITHLAANSKVLCLRGTCVYVLSLLGRSTAGIEALQEYGWKLLPGHKNCPIALPIDLNKLIHLDSWEYKGAFQSDKVSPFRLSGMDVIEQDILKNIGTLSNHILAKGASRNLARTRMEYPAYFSKVSLYVPVMAMVSRMHYRLTARRFIQDLFDKVSFDEEALEAALDDISS